MAVFLRRCEFKNTKILNSLPYPNTSADHFDNLHGSKHVLRGGDSRFCCRQPSPLLGPDLFTNNNDCEYTH